LNQRDRIASWATIRDSEPAPNTNRPANSIALDRARATISAPSTTRLENRKLARRVPSLSVSTPPTKTIAIAASE
jgi:hypothetical protein